MYSKHLDSLSVVVESPIRRKRFRISPEYAEAWAQIQDGGRFHQRPLGERIGFTLGATSRFTHTLRNAGLARVYTARGCKGVTVIRPVNGARIVSGLRSFADRLGDVLAKIRGDEAERAESGRLAVLSNVPERTREEISLSTYGENLSSRTSGTFGGAKPVPIGDVLADVLRDRFGFVR